jgi:hypothetical protein
MSILKRTVQPNKDGDFTKKQHFEYFLYDQNQRLMKVCAKFYLNKLGLKNSNNNMIERMINTPKLKKRFTPKHSEEIKKSIENHILSYNPTISHYRRVYAPNVRYLPSAISIKLCTTIT